jgi:uncharacterized protein YkwD
MARPLTARYFQPMARDAQGHPLSMLAAVAALLAATLVATVGLLASPRLEAASAASCANAEVAAQGLERKALRKALTCLINKERKQRDLVKVRKNRQLQKAAQRHTNVMVKTGCLLHQCPGEADIDQRVRRTGYLDGARRWAYAENTGCAVSAKAMFGRWMDSDYHRGNMLRRKFRHVGVGVSEQPAGGECKPEHATFTAVFGWRKA